MKRELRRGNGGDVSSVLRDEIAQNLERGEQSILFLNRRGANKLITCGECGYTYKCPRCSVSLTYHSANRRLMCHYCGYSRTVDAACPDCGGILSYVGSGTQKVEQELRDLFPGTEILRMGIGEPLDNFDNVVQFLRLVNHPDGMDIGMRHISLSTCGITEMFDKLADLNLQLTLSVSLHAPDDETRSRIMWSCSTSGGRPMRPTPRVSPLLTWRWSTPWKRTSCNSVSRNFSLI